jgi:hypothetical protein
MNERKSGRKREKARAGLRENESRTRLTGFLCQFCYLLFAQLRLLTSGFCRLRIGFAFHLLKGATSVSAGVSSAVPSAVTDLGSFLRCWLWARHPRPHVVCAPLLHSDFEQTTHPLPLIHVASATKTTAEGHLSARPRCQPRRRRFGSGHRRRGSHGPLGRTAPTTAARAAIR